MNQFLFLIPLLLIISIPTAFAQTPEEPIFNTMQVLPDGTILDANGDEILFVKTWQLSQTTDIIQVQLETGKIVFQKDSGAVTVFDDMGIVIKSDSYVVRGAELNTDVWSNLSVNDVSTTFTIEETPYNAIITFTKENTEGKFDVETILGNDVSKTTAKFTNYIYDNYKFAFTETLDFPDNLVKLNSQDIDLTLYAGQSFPREVLEQNMDLVLQAKEIYFNAGFGFEYLWQVNISADNKVSLDWANVGERLTAIGETVELDPTYSFTIGGNGAGSANNQFNYSMEVAIDSSNNLYVADNNNQRIQKFDSSSTYLSTIGGNGAGSANNQFNHPRGVATDSSNNVYVADHINHRIQKFDSSGSYLFTLGGNGAGTANNQFYYPMGVATDSSNNLYVADQTNHRIQKFDSSGTYLSTIGGNGGGSANNQLYNPIGVVTDSSNNLYVGDQSNHRIQKFDSSGTYLSTIGTGISGSTNNQFNHPRGLAIDSSNNLYVADQNNNRIQKFDSSSTYLLTIGGNGAGSANNQFNSPMGVEIDSNNNLYVADQTNHRIQVFTQVSAPSSPTGMTTSQSVANQITLNWTAPSSGSVPSSYEVYLNGVLIDTIGNVITYTDNITGGEIGSGLTYYVVAINSAGSATSGTSFITAWNIPDVVTGFQAVTGSPITMSWVTPLSDDTITNFKIYRDSTLLTTLGNVNSYTDNTGVVGNSYSYTASAVSAVGEGSQSSSSSATAGIPPDAPTNLTSVISDPNATPLTISLNWDSPTNFGTAGSLSGYEVYRDGILITTIGTTSLYNDTVPNSGTFIYTIKAISAHGTSVPSSNTSITTANVPDAITDLSVSVITDTTVTLTWGVPNSNGSNIVDYTLYRDGVLISTSTTTGFPDVSLTQQTSYDYTVYARNNVGLSSISNGVTQVTDGVPGVVSFNATTASLDQINLTWTAPNDYNSAITNYIIERESPTGNGFAPLITLGSILSYSDGSLAAVTEYNYRITAVNGYGNGATSTSSAITLPAPPTNVVVTPSSSTSELIITWDTPTLTTGITGYEIFREDGIGTGFSPVSVATGVTFTDTGLTPNIYYNYKLTSVTTQGNSAYSNTYSQTTFNLPDSVQSLVATPGALIDATLTWSPPAIPYGYIINYNILQSATGTPTVIIDSTTGTSYTATNLDPTSTYSWIVAPVTIHGTNSTGNIANATATSEIVIGNIALSTDTNPDTVSILFDEVRNGNSTALTVTYGTATDLNCEFDYKFARTNYTLDNLAQTVVSGSQSSHTFTFNNSANEIISVHCYDDTANPGGDTFINDQTDGKYQINFANQPIVTQVNDFQKGLFGISSGFGAFDLMTMFVVIISMMGFNRTNPAVGVGIMIAFIGAMGYFGIIEVPTIMMGIIALVVVLAIGNVTKK